MTPRRDDALAKGREVVACVAVIILLNTDFSRLANDMEGPAGGPAGDGHPALRAAPAPSGFLL